MIAKKDPHFSIWKDLFILSVFLISLFFLLLGTRPLFTPDEGRYAEIAREMVVSGDYVTPYLNGIKYFEKPVLFYWLGAFAIKVGGLNLWSLRSINALLAWLACLCTYLTARKVYNRKTGLMAAFILGTSTLYFVMAHTISLDLTVTCFLTTSLYSFLLGASTEDSRKRYLYFGATAFLAALAVLTKGLIGIVFPGMIIAIWLTLMSRWRLLNLALILSSIAIFLAVALPWHVIVSLRNPEFLRFYFIDQHFLRYTSLAIGHYQPAWFFIPCLVLGFFPWSVFIIQTLFTSFPKSWKTRHDKAADLFFLLWAVLIFIFFSFSHSKLIPYILPVFPPLAILTANHFNKISNKKISLATILSFVALILIAIAILYVFFIHGQSGVLTDPKAARFYLSLAGVLLLLGSVMTFIVAFKNFIKSFYLLAVTMWLFLLFALASIPAVDTRTVRPLADTLKPILQSDNEIITYNRYYQDLPFYLERKVSILNWRNELSYGMQHQDASEWMINDQTFWQHWHSKRRIYVILGQDDYEVLLQKHPNERFYLLNKTPNNVLISNQKNHFPDR